MTRTDPSKAALIVYPLLLLLFMGLPLQGRSQFNDDFSDGNFTAGPAWSGDTSDFTITYSSAVPELKRPALKLDGTGEDTSFLVVPSTLSIQAEWRFWIKLSFNSSANNFARFYLLSDQPDLTGPLEGYFVQVGGSNDSIGLFRQSGAAIFPLITGSSAFTGNSTNVLHVKVTRDDGGTWQLFCDPVGGYDFVIEGSIADAVIESSNFAGIYCRYTSSNASKFYFDDFHAADLYADTLPPVMEDLLFDSPQVLRVIFSEVVEPGSAQDSLNYQVDGGVGHPVAVMLDPTDQSSVLLVFDTAFPSGVMFHLDISNVRDLAGNIMIPQYYPFSLDVQSAIQPGQLLIHEVMADIDPAPAGLPEAEYIELFNPGPEAVDLNGSTLQPRESSLPLSFPGVVLPAGGYLLVARPSDTALFEGYGPVAGLGGFGVNNEGVIILRNDLGQTLHAVAYSRDTYHDPQKESGGWSLELSDAGNACAMDEVWGACIHAEGGTPGSGNSISGVVTSPPAVESLFLIGPQRLQVRFSHQMDSASLADPLKYHVPGFGSPLSAIAIPPFFDVMELYFELPFPENGVYKLVLGDTLADYCGGSLLPGLEYTYVQPGHAASWDIVINEVMADWDPPAGLPGHEYIELFNVTDGYLRIQDWTLTVADGTCPVPTIIAGPGEYLLLVGEEEALIMNLFARSFVVDGMSLPNAGAVVTLTDAEGTLISGCEYDKALYSDPDLALGGYSLELMDPYNPCGGRGNWLPSNAAAGGTPGTINSVDANYGKGLAIGSALVRNGTELHVVFDMKLDKDQLSDPTLYQVDQGMGSPTQVAVADVFGSVIHLIFDVDFQPGILYSLAITQPLINCVGQSCSVSEGFTFGVPETPLTQDAVINEVLFNPAGDGVDFVEIVNRSHKILNLRDMVLGTVREDAFGAMDTLLYTLVEADFLFLMGELVVLTRDPDRVQDQYTCGDPSRFCQLGSFPVLTNDEGSVMLLNRSGQVIDRMEYRDDMHHPLLKITDGVSLERLHPDRSSGDPTNWHSASSGSGYATPALQNSQYDSFSEKTFALWVDPEIFSPDNDGFEDFVTIGYRFDAPGFMASVTIFDAEGRPIRSLVNNVLLGTSGFLTWDGITDDRRKAGIGIYVIYFEAFDPAGRLERNLVTVVLAGHLN